MAEAPRAFDAVVLAASPHAQTVLLGLTLRERGLRMARKVGARRVLVVDANTPGDTVRAWAAERGDAGLLVVRAGDQMVHPPLVQPLLDGAGARRLAVGPAGDFGGALYAEGAAAGEALDAIAAAPTGAVDAALAAAWTDATRIPHGEIARHAATTPAERKGAAKLLLRILVKASEDSPISKYVYRPLSRPLTRALLHTPITANQVSYIVACIGLFGCFLTSRAGQTNLIVGAALVFVSGVIDGCDGEISRLKLTSSPFGAWLDTVVDEATTLSYLVAIGYHTYRGHPEPWIGASIAVGALCMVSTVYAIYYFCIVVLKRGGSQYYVGDLVIVDSPDGPTLTPRPRAASKLPPWMISVGHVLMYLVRRDLINLVALVLTCFNAYAFIYAGMWLGAVVAALVTVPEHLKLRRQLRTLRARGAATRFVAA